MTVTFGPPSFLLFRAPFVSVVSLGSPSSQSSPSMSPFMRLGFSRVVRRRELICPSSSSISSAFRFRRCLEALLEALSLAGLLRRTRGVRVVVESRVPDSKLPAAQLGHRHVEDSKQRNRVRPGKLAHSTTTAAARIRTPSSNTDLTPPLSFALRSQLRWAGRAAVSNCGDRWSGADSHRKPNTQRIPVDPHSRTQGRDPRHIDNVCRTASA